MVKAVGVEGGAVEPQFQDETWVGLQFACRRCGKINQVESPEDTESRRVHTRSGLWVANVRCAECGYLGEVASTVVDDDWAKRQEEYLACRAARRKAIRDEQFISSLLVSGLASFVVAFFIVVIIFG